MKFRLKSASGTHTGQPFELLEATEIGSESGCDICLEGIASRHARIVFDGEVLMLESASESWVNGEAASKRALTSGDEIRFGAHRFVLQAPGLRPPNVLVDAPRRRVRPWLWVGLGAAAVGAAVLWYLWSF